MNIKMYGGHHYTVNIASAGLPALLLEVTYEDSMTWWVSCPRDGLLDEFERLEFAFDFCRSHWIESVREATHNEFYKEL